MNRAVRIAICEDQPQEAFLLDQLLQSSAAQRGIDFTLSHFASAEDLLQGFLPGQFDLLFLDIYLGRMTGLQAAEQIRKTGDDCQIVFITGSRDFALAGYGVGALHYLVKPYAPQMLEEAIDRALVRMEDLESQTLTLMVDRRLHTLALRDILYVESQNKQCLVHTTGEVLATRMPMDQMAKLLPMPPFLRCHRSAVVNLGHVRDIGRDFIMGNGDIVCIRQVALRGVKEQYLKYLMNITRNDLRG